MGLAQESQELLVFCVFVLRENSYYLCRPDTHIALTSASSAAQVMAEPSSKAREDMVL